MKLFNKNFCGIRCDRVNILLKKSFTTDSFAQKNLRRDFNLSVLRAYSGKRSVYAGLPPRLRSTF